MHDIGMKGSADPSSTGFCGGRVRGGSLPSQATKAVQMIHCQLAEKEAVLR